MLGGNDAQKPMSELQHFSIVDDHAEYRPTGQVSILQMVQLVASAIAFAREQQLRKLLVVISGLAGFQPPVCQVIDRRLSDTFGKGVCQIEFVDMRDLRQGIQSNVLGIIGVDIAFRQSTFLG